MTPPASDDERSDRLARASSAVGTGILLSRVAGLLREKLLAYHLGTGLGAEAFRAALRIPNLLQNLLGDGVLSGAFVPTYARMVRDGREEDAGRLAGAVASLLVLVTGLLVVVGVVFAGPITRVLTPGFPVGSAKAELTVTLVRIITPSLGFLVLSAWSLGVLNAHRRFFRAYVAPVLWNATIIVFLSVAATLGGTELDLARAVALGALVGAVLQFLSQLPAVLRSVPTLRMRLGRSVPGLREVVRASGGVIAGRGIVQLSAYLDLVVASLLAAGAVAALGYAQVLYLLPVSLFGMSVAAAALPDVALVRPHERLQLAAEVERGMARVATFVVPTIAIYLVLGEQVVTLLFGGGAFGPAATRQVAIVLAAYSLGLLATTQSRLLQSTLYGLDDTFTPARIAAVRVGVATVAGVALMLVFDAYRWGDDGIVRVADMGLASSAARASLESLHRLGAVGLALGASLGAWTEWILLRRAVARRATTTTPRSRALRPGFASIAIVVGVPLGHELRSALTILDGAPVPLGAAITLLPALSLFAVAAIALDLADLPLVTATRQWVTDHGFRTRPRRTR
ncbi:MAG: murein biosynthesis integral membrane protein MurJ [Actinomycetota bacterium]|nr:murein biosynthesis integral membrane protein MurJ [Actinomycetota bacterium]